MGRGLNRAREGKHKAELAVWGREGLRRKGGSPVFERKAAYIRETASSFLMVDEFMKLLLVAKT